MSVICNLRKTIMSVICNLRKTIMSVICNLCKTIMSVICNVRKTIMSVICNLCKTITMYKTPLVDPALTRKLSVTYIRFRTRTRENMQNSSILN